MGRALLLGVLLLAGLLALVLWRVLPGQRTHALTSTSFRQLEASGVGHGAIDRLLPLQDREFVDPSELVAAAEALLEPAEVERIGERLRRSIRTRPCGPNRSARRVHRIQSSRDHPLYDRLRAHTLVPQAELPAVPTQLVFLPGDRGAFVLGKLGELAHFDAALHATSALHIPGVYQGGGDQGAVAVLPAPDFPESCHLYVAFVSEAGDRNVVQRLCWEGDAEAAAESLVDVLRFPKDDALEVHGIGGLHFTGDGTLLVAVGDPSQDHAQRPFDLEGKLLAVPPEHLKPGFFVIPHGARFATLRSFLSWPRPTIVASGLRAPFSLTPWRGMLLIGDVGDDGWGSHEEIQLYSAPGANYGWPECRDPDLHAD
ncbi:MAG: PQQ-dependent sugar dehydrogenase, partial [Proteobacteria bacterium]|nr:PQQ-dependent sugar dehydrogenase [Pseudomonadota bacterium]